MANAEHVAILNQGVRVWDPWRGASPSTRPDLTGADLTRANLYGADLRVADLTGADLSRADLTGTVLARARLSWADLTGADLGEADLTGADLNTARAIRTNFAATSLSGADIADAMLGRTHFARVDLRGVKGLEQVVHQGPSTIGIDTLYASEGDIPDVFLRGCGVPEEMIEFAHALSGAVQIYSCFISYAVKDEVFARRLYADLQAAGVGCWLAQEDLKPGDRTWTVIEDQIRVKDKLLLILSEASIEGEAVQREVEHGLAQEGKTGRQILFPIYIDDVALKSRKRWIVKLRDERNFGKFTGWEEPVIYSARLHEVVGWLKPHAASAASS